MSCCIARVNPLWHIRKHVHTVHACTHKTRHSFLQLLHNPMPTGHRHPQTVPPQHAPSPVASILRLPLLMSMTKPDWRVVSSGWGCSAANWAVSCSVCIDGWSEVHRQVHQWHTSSTVHPRPMSMGTCSTMQNCIHLCISAMLHAYKTLS